MERYGISDIADHLKTQEGFSLLLKGEPGSGKTTFALELLNELGAVNGIYFSLRVTSKSLHKHFPWLKDSANPLIVLDTKKSYVSGLSTYRSVFGNLQSFPEVLCSRLDMIEGPTTIVLDSWDAVMAQVMDLERKNLLEAEITELVRARGVNLILTSETIETSTLDYMVDGIILVKDVVIDYRHAREAVVKKMRGGAIKQKRYPFTLHNGRFTAFPPFQFQKLKSNVHIENIAHPENHLSTGSSDFDRILGGGFRRGSFNVFEVGDDISSWGFQTIIGFAIVNALREKNWFVYLPCCGRRENFLKKRIIPFLDENTYREKVKVFEIHTENFEPTENVYPLKGENIKEDLGKIKEHISSLKSPVLTFLGVDALEYPYKLNVHELGSVGDAIKLLSSHISNTKARGDVDIARVSSDLVLYPWLVHMASTYFRVTTIDQTVIFYGLKPETGLYNIDVKLDADGSFKLRITPFV